MLGEEEWPVLEKYGMTCSMGSGICSIPDGLNVKENHAQIEKNFRRLLPAAKKAGVPNLICCSRPESDTTEEAPGRAAPAGRARLRCSMETREGEQGRAHGSLHNDLRLKRGPTEIGPLHPIFYFSVRRTTKSQSGGGGVAMFSSHRVM